MAWHAKPTKGYLYTSHEAYANCVMIKYTLIPLGWTLNAVCGLLGNINNESAYNPWRWQSDKVGRAGGSPWRNKGYGFTQFTNAGKYIDAKTAQMIEGYAPNFIDRAGKPSDGYAQIVFLNSYADYYRTQKYPINYANYKHSTLSPEYLASAWLYNYERPADPLATEASRRQMARYWFDKLSGEQPEPDPIDPDDPNPPPPDPTPPEPEPQPPPVPVKQKRMKWIYYQRRYTYYKNF